MATTRGCNFLMSRSCLVPINRATTVSTALATSMKGFAVSWRCSARVNAPAAHPQPVQTFYSNCLDAPAPRTSTRRGTVYRVEEASTGTLWPLASEAEEELD